MADNIYSGTFSYKEKPSSAKFNTLISNINAHLHDGTANGGGKIAFTNLSDLASIKNIANGPVILDSSAKLPAVDGSAVTNITPPTGSVIQVVNYTLTGNHSGTGTYSKGALPTTAGGDLLMSVSIQPKSASNKLFVQAFIANTGDPNPPITALFRDSGVNCLASSFFSGYENWFQNSPLIIFTDASSTIATTFKVRIGQDSSGGGTWYVNNSSGASTCGGSIVSSITVMEIKG